jgi:hypothetical protein
VDALGHRQPGDLDAAVVDGVQRPDEAAADVQPAEVAVGPRHHAAVRAEGPERGVVKHEERAGVEAQRHQLGVAQAERIQLRLRQRRRLLGPADTLEARPDAR